MALVKKIVFHTGIGIDWLIGGDPDKPMVDAAGEPWTPPVWIDKKTFKDYNRAAVIGEKLRHVKVGKHEVNFIQSQSSYRCKITVGPDDRLDESIEFWCKSTELHKAEAMILAEIGRRNKKAQDDVIVAMAEEWGEGTLLFGAFRKAFDWAGIPFGPFTKERIVELMDQYEWQALMMSAWAEVLQEELLRLEQGQEPRRCLPEGFSIKEYDASRRRLNKIWPPHRRITGESPLEKALNDNQHR